MKPEDFADAVVHDVDALSAGTGDDKLMTCTKAELLAIIHNRLTEVGLNAILDDISDDEVADHGRAVELLKRVVAWDRDGDWQRWSDLATDIRKTLAEIEGRTP